VRKHSQDTTKELNIFERRTRFLKSLIRCWGDDQAMGIESAIRVDFEEKVEKGKYSGRKATILYWTYSSLFIPMIWIRSKISYYLGVINSKKEKKGD